MFLFMSVPIRSALFFRCPWQRQRKPFLHARCPLCSDASLPIAELEGNGLGRGWLAWPKLPRAVLMIYSQKGSRSCAWEHPWPPMQHTCQHKTELCVQGRGIRPFPPGFLDTEWADGVVPPVNTFVWQGSWQPAPPLLGKHEAAGIFL